MLGLHFHIFLGKRCFQRIFWWFVKMWEQFGLWAFYEMMMRLPEYVGSEFKIKPVQQRKTKIPTTNHNRTCTSSRESSVASFPVRRFFFFFFCNDASCEECKVLFAVALCVDARTYATSHDDEKHSFAASFFSQGRGGSSRTVGAFIHKLCYNLPKQTDLAALIIA